MTDNCNALIIEDSLQDFAVLEQTFGQRGLRLNAHRIETAEELRQALKSRDWDVIVSAFRLANFSAMDALQILHAEGLDIPFILVAGPIREEDAVALMKAGAHDYVNKLNPVRLLPVIEREVRDCRNRRAKRQAEQLLRESEKRYRSLVEFSPVPIVVLGSKEWLVYLNNVAIHTLGGRAREDFSDKSIWDFVESSDQRKILRMERLLGKASAGPVMVELGIKRLDGKELEIEAVATLVDYEGHPAIQVVFLDITERKQAETKLRQAAAVYRSTSEGVMICDVLGNIIAVNNAFTSITGYPDTEALGRNPRFLKSGRHDELFYAHLWKSVRDLGYWQGEIWNRRKNGEVFPEWMRISRIEDNEGQATNYVAVFSDVSHIKQSQEKLEHLAHFDALTDLPNRLLFQARLSHALERSKREEHQLAVLFLGLDRFKTINDSLGHPVGDQLLQQVATRLGGLVRGYDTLARLGGDEFTILMEHLEDPKDAASYAASLLDSFAQPYQVKSRDLYLSASVGISMYPEDGDDTETLTKHADVAMHRAKDQGRNNYQFFTTEMTSNAFERFFIETHLRHSLVRGEMVLHYQPQISLKNHQIVGGEALVRWMHPDMGMISPTRFIPLAEESGLIISIGEWVLRTACEHVRDWTERGLFHGRMAVNLSGHQIQRIDLFDTVTGILAETGCPPEHLQLEVTEGFIMERSKHAVHILRALGDLGIMLAIDDFGTGYSSLSYLKQLPIHKLKIDKSFVAGIPGDADDEAIVRAIISMGGSLGLEVTAEGVENEEQRGFLQRERCDEVQGYLFSRPIPADEFEDFLQEHSYTTSTLG